ncbi:MAG: helix-turn-helix transcriptional regulator [Flavobacteriaceae bacterium]|jgi:transcriptional regulator with XRE-family HTH domain|nr:helix-turn-helix transcriptional regulator [Flavobacteriaceae bacterium]
MNNVGTNIRKIRERKGYSQESMASELGINQSTYGKLERDASKLSLDRLETIAKFLHEDLGEILGIANKNTINNKTKYGNGYVETISNDYREVVQDIKSVYEELIQSKNEQISLLKSLLPKK